MMRWLFAAAVSVTMVCLCAGTLFGQSDVIIDIHDPGVVRIKIGVPPFVRDPASPAASPGLGEEIARVIREDLAFTGLFDVLDSPSQPVAPEGGALAFAPLKAFRSLVRLEAVSSSTRTGASFTSTNRLFLRTVRPSTSRTIPRPCRA